MTRARDRRQSSLLRETLPSNSCRLQTPCAGAVTNSSPVPAPVPVATPGLAAPGRSRAHAASRRQLGAHDDGAFAHDPEREARPAENLRQRQRDVDPLRLQRADVRIQRLVETGSYTIEMREASATNFSACRAVMPWANLNVIGSVQASVGAAVCTPGVGAPAC